MKGNDFWDNFWGVLENLLKMTSNDGKCVLVHFRKFWEILGNLGKSWEMMGNDMKKWEIF